NRGYIIHGVGSGKLARGIHEILRNEPKVKSFKLGDPEVGGSGVTVVEIK
ncbi:MAG: Smr/MutS family protein, partial [Thermotogae bacterium]|nr:Smr/MutS family protein [Thermotogota bacterium]